MSRPLTSTMTATEQVHHFWDTCEKSDFDFTAYWTDFCKDFRKDMNFVSTNQTTTTNQPTSNN